MQMNFNLPKINRVETRNAVESVLVKYKIFLLMDPEELQPKKARAFYKLAFIMRIEVYEEARRT